MDVDGDEAHAETYYLFIGTDREPANHMTVSGGRYVDRLERRRAWPPTSLTSYPLNRRVRLGQGFTTQKTEERGLLIPGGRGTVPHRAA
ncbi:hypothetical protein [Mycolicibacterium vulneris]|uniref:hypothetical protein n=1 Tax=Mycolicibacterium vulneris TaxID=547163 RepID=UPI0031838CBE